MNYISKGEFRIFWEKGLFIFDTNTLLFLLNCNHTHLKNLLDLFMLNNDKIWIPRQVRDEIDVLRLKGHQEAVIKNSEKILTKLISDVSKTFQSRSTELENQGYNDLADLIRGVDVNDMFYNFLNLYNSKSKELTEENRKFLRNKVIKTFFGKLFMKVGEGFTDEEIEKIQAEGERRYENKIPPGWADHRKEGKDKYGDLIIWKEILKKGRDSKKPILFITRDTEKGDWFEILDNGSIQPHRKLIHEYNSFTNSTIPFNIIRFIDFVELSKDYINEDTDKLIEHIKVTELEEKIEMALQNDYFQEVNDVITQYISQDVQADWGMLDAIHHVSVEITEKYEEDEEIILDVIAEIEASVDHNYHHDGETYELSGNAAIFQLICKVNLNITLGEYNNNNKILEVEDIEIQFDKVNVIKFDDPMGHDEQDYDEQDYDEEDYDIQYHD